MHLKVTKSRGKRTISEPEISEYHEKIVFIWVRFISVESDVWNFIHPKTESNEYIVPMFEKNLKILQH